MIDSLGDRNDSPQVSKSPKHTNEIDTAQRAEHLREIQAQERNQPESIPDPEKSIDRVNTYQRIAKDHDYWGYSEFSNEVVNFIEKESAMLLDSGVSFSEMLHDSSFLTDFKSRLKSQIVMSKKEKAKNETLESTSTKEALHARFQELKKSEGSVASMLQTLREEFGDQIDQETASILDKYSTLLSSQVFADPEELEAVETLFFTQSRDFTAQSFTTFVQTIYDEPDSVISEASKRKIEETFNIPRTPITTGRELSNATQLTKEDGSFVHDSEDTALEFRPGVKTYMSKNGEAVLSLDGSSRPYPISIPPHLLENGESIAELANYALIRQTVYEEMGQLTNLFGGGTETELDNPDENTIQKANHFARLLIGRQAPDTILSSDDLDDLKHALKALHNPSKIGETASLLSLNELGILENGNFQWERLDTIGSILREKKFYRTFEMTKSGEAHRLLTSEMERQSPYENTSKTEMSAFESCGHGVFYGLNRWISRVFSGITGIINTNHKNHLLRNQCF